MEGAWVARSTNAPHPTDGIAPILAPAKILTLKEMNWPK
jgi:hypothetical protein